MKKTLFTAVVAVLSIYCLGPLIWQFLTSIKPDFEITSLPPVFPRHLVADHYISVFTGHPFCRIIFNSLIVASATTLFSILLACLCAFGLTKLCVRFKIPFLGFILAISMFPPIATVSPLYIIIRTLGLRDTLWALIATYSAFSLPLAIWILVNFFHSIPDDIYRSARVDGCSPFQAFLRIILPLALPGLSSTAILLFIFSWNEFLFALTFTSTPASRTIPPAIALFPGMHEVPWGEIAAASVIVTAPLVFLVFVFQKKISEGISAGAVKG